MCNINVSLLVSDIMFWFRVRLSSSSTLLSHRGPALLGEEASDDDINGY